MSTLAFDTNFSTAQFNTLTLGDMHPLLMTGFLFTMGNDLFNVYMNHSGVQSLLKSGEKFDVCVIEIFNIEAFLVKI